MESAVRGTSDLWPREANFGEGRTIAEYREKQVVFAQIDPADAVIYVQKGKVKLTIVSNARKQAIIAILGSGDFLGEGCLAAQLIRVATATALSDCVTVRLEKPALIRVSRWAGLFRDVPGLCALPEHAD